MTPQGLISLVPLRPFCTDDPRDGLRRLPRSQAVSKRHIQLNHTNSWNWLLFDLDHEDSWFQPEERGCPPPHFISINRANGHAHVGYMLDAPVTTFSSSHAAPAEFFVDVERGLCRKLGADSSYCGLICKNPTHPGWETDWQAQRPYDLLRLNDFLDKKDKRRIHAEPISGMGRNCALFDILRRVAYMKVLEYKRAGRSLREFEAELQTLAVNQNRAFPMPLFLQEVRSISKSVSRWTWERFTPGEFSAIQAARSAKRWSKQGIPLSTTEPWIKGGVSRATFYRRRKSESLQQCGEAEKY